MHPLPTRAHAGRRSCFGGVSDSSGRPAMAVAVARAPHLFAPAGARFSDFAAVNSYQTCVVASAANNGMQRTRN